ncbi:hypothetical protein [Stenomitos frigidus]|nr:hypothetical protein [Stenomitos frigidus]
MAETEGNPAEARICLPQALEIFVEFSDEYGATIVRKALDRLGS